ncbi:unnamed protein product [marine sediment metagenome]|uniref:Uncharacterized protein n=1 Tax=marine sediment metagenome TaxID=412755 RepID=X1M1N2_9ZZZZ
MSNTEEWQFFERIEELEKIAKGLKSTETTALDGAIVGMIAFALAFFAFYESTPSSARAGKDELMLRLKKLPLSQQTVDGLEEMMLKMCDGLERKR